MLLSYWSGSIFSFFISFFCFGLFFYSPMGIPKVLSSVWVVDTLSWTLVMLSLWVGALVVVNGCEHKKEVIFSFVIIILTAILVLCFISSNGFMFYFFYESSLLPVAILLIFWGSQPERLEAAKYLAVYTVGGSLSFFLGLVHVVHSQGHVDFFFLMWPSMFKSWMGACWWVCLSIAFLVKVPLYFFHLWLPKAHVEAPVGGSMVLAGVLLKLGVYGVLRVYSMCADLSKLYLNWLSCFALFGGAVTGFICLRQSDLKLLIAYSSVCHMSLIVSGWSGGSSMGFMGGLTVSVTHGLCSSGLFALVGWIYSIFSTRSMILVKGILSAYPMISFWWFLLCALSMGVPPSLGFFGELLLVGANIMFSWFFLFLLGVILFFSAAYVLSFYSGAQQGVAPNWAQRGVFPVRCHFVLSMHVLPLFLLSFCPSNFLNWL